MQKRTSEKFSLAKKDEEMMALVGKSSQKILAAWAIDCSLRVLPYFEQKYPMDFRPREALETLQHWMNTGVFKMSIIRKTSLDSHAAAREVGEDNSARSAARACGQAVATAHVPRHAYGSAIYSQQATFRTNPDNPTEAADSERNWQYAHLKSLLSSPVKNLSVLITEGLMQSFTCDSS